MGEGGEEFRELFRRKVEERRAGRSRAMERARQAERRLHALVAPTREAFDALVTRLHADPVFAKAFPGRPAVTVRRSEARRDAGMLHLDGAVGSLHVVVAAEELAFEILPSHEVGTALGRTGFHLGADGPRGTPADIPAFMAEVEDYVAEFLADIHLSRASGMIAPTAG